MRAVVDGEPKYTKAAVCEREPGDDGADLVAGRGDVGNPVTPYRFLVETPAGSGG